MKEIKRSREKRLAEIGVSSTCATRIFETEEGNIRGIIIHSFGINLFSYCVKVRVADFSFFSQEEEGMCMFHAHVKHYYYIYTQKIMKV